MARFNGNGAYLDLDGTAIHADFIDVSYEPSMDTTETTAGSSTVWRTRNEGLQDASGTISIAYDTTTIATNLPLIKVGAHTMTYGPEGTTVGKPKHVHPIIITGAPHKTTVGKEFVVFQVPFSSAGAPTTDMFSGGVWA